MEFVDTVGKIILGNNFEGLVVKNDHSENVKVMVCLKPCIEVGRCGSDCSSIAVRRKLIMECLSAWHIHDIDKRQSEVMAISRYLIMGIIIWT